MGLLPTLKTTKPVVATATATKPVAPTPIAPKPATVATSPVAATMPQAAKAAGPVPAVPGYTPKETDVAKIAAGITGQDSLLMRQARTEGLKTAARRGLLSSSIAAGAAQGAVVGKATEMAQATAGFNAAENVATADRLSAEKIAADNRALEQKLTTQKITSEQKLQSQRIAAESKEKNLDRGLQTELAKWNLDASDREKAASMLTTYSSLYEQQLASINANKDLNATQRTAQIDALNARRTAYVQTVRELYDIDISFAKPPKPGAKPKPTTNEVVSTKKIDVWLAKSKVGDVVKLDNGQTIRHIAGGKGWELV